MTETLTYAQQLRHPNWQRRRLEVLQRANFACVRCGDTERELHAHHKVYIRGRMAWDYSDELLECLCSTCHDRAHEQKDRLDLILAKRPTSELSALAKIMDALGSALSSPYPQQRMDALNRVRDELDAREDLLRGAGWIEEQAA